MNVMRDNICPESFVDKCFIKFEKINALKSKDCAKALATKLQAGDCIALWGDFGAGKSSFARALIRALCHEEFIPSPSYTLVETYECDINGQKLPLYHGDLYRIKNPHDLEPLNLLTDNDALYIIEWPAVLATHLPVKTLHICLAHAEDAHTRKICFYSESDMTNQRFKTVLSAYG